ncbi:MAG: hypothetical protein ABI761_15390 [Saprospiraceae bacterium]
MADIIGAFGVSLILLAYFLNLFNRIDTEHWVYILLNLIGASLAFWSSFLIHSKPFIVLEATWAIVSLIALIKKIKTAL